MGYEPTSTPANASQRPRLNRSRWAAIGAAVAVSLGAGGFGLANATISDGEMPVYIAIDPCRLTDTRPQFLVGPRATPYGPNETVTWTGTGAQGNCNVPAGVSSLVLNVTALDATLPTYLQFAPGTTVTPGGASSLNPVPNQPPTPNAVTTPIDDDGKFSVYNLQGTVHVIIDVVGYYDDHEHTGADIVDGSLTGADIGDGSLTGADIGDGSLTGADIEDESLTGADIEDESLTGADIDNGSLTNVDIGNESGIVYSFTSSADNITSTPSIVSGVSMRVPSNGWVSVDVTGNWSNNAVGSFDIAQCAVTKGTDFAGAQQKYWLNDMNGELTLALVGFSLHATFPVALADNPANLLGGQTFNLMCDELGGNITIYDVTMTATFHSQSYNPLPTIVLPTFPVITLAEPEATEPEAEVTEVVTENTDAPVTATTVPTEG